MEFRISSNANVAFSIKGFKLEDSRIEKKIADIVIDKINKYNYLHFNDYTFTNNRAFKVYQIQIDKIFENTCLEVVPLNSELATEIDMFCVRVYYGWGFDEKQLVNYFDGIHFEGDWFNSEYFDVWLIDDEEIESFDPDMNIIVEYKNGIEATNNLGKDTFRIMNAVKEIIRNCNRCNANSRYYAFEIERKIPEMIDFNTYNSIKCIMVQIPMSECGYGTLIIANFDEKSIARED